MESRASDLALGIREGLGFRVSSWGFRGLGVWVQGLGLVWCLGVGFEGLDLLGAQGLTSFPKRCSSSWLVPQEANIAASELR